MGKLEREGNSLSVLGCKVLGRGPRSASSVSGKEIRVTGVPVDLLLKEAAVAIRTNGFKEDGQRVLFLGHFFLSCIHY